MRLRRQLLRNIASWMTIGFIPSALLRSRVALASNTFIDPRPEFASRETRQILAFYFGTTDAADDATIEIEAPLVSGSKEIVPFRVIAPGAEKLVVVSTINSQPLILAMDQIRESIAVVNCRARLSQTGEIVCYSLRNGQVGRASRRVSLSGHWDKN